nr:MAG TPA: hypothetical protein [Caudoviricetes sp.]
MESSQPSTFIISQLLSISSEEATTLKELFSSSFKSFTSSKAFARASKTKIFIFSFIFLIISNSIL